MKKKHPHKRAIPKEQRKELREQGKAWWIKNDAGRTNGKSPPS